MTIIVTADDIACGVRRDSQECPIARAAWRAGVRIVVGNVTYRTLDGTRGGRLPLRIAQWVRRFDAGESVAPITWTIRQPEPHTPKGPQGSTT